MNITFHNHYDRNTAALSEMTFPVEAQEEGRCLVRLTSNWESENKDVYYTVGAGIATGADSDELVGGEFDRELTGDVWYSLQKVRIPKPTASGVYIHNGKKVVVGK